MTIRMTAEVEIDEEEMADELRAEGWLCIDCDNLKRRTFLEAIEDQLNELDIIPVTIHDGVVDRSKLSDDDYDMLRRACFDDVEAILRESHVLVANDNPSVLPGGEHVLIKALARNGYVTMKAAELPELTDDMMANKLEEKGYLVLECEAEAFGNEKWLHCIQRCMESAHEIHGLWGDALELLVGPAIAADIQGEIFSGECGVQHVQENLDQLDLLQLNKLLASTISEIQKRVSKK